MDFSRVKPPPVGLSVPRHVLEQLRRLDPRLDIQWCYDQERWRVMEWVAGKFNRWMVSFYWTGTNGEYRPVDSAEPILLKLASVDFEKYGKSRWKGAIDGEIAARRQEFVGRRNELIAGASREHVGDMMERAVGVRQTFGSTGALRSRNFAEKGSAVLDKFWADRRAELAAVQEGLESLPAVTTDGGPNA